MQRRHLTAALLAGLWPAWPHAAEAAVPEARTLFVSTAKTISVEDALQLVRGGPTSVTDYFAGSTACS